jgi:hypothetical protein
VSDAVDGQAAGPSTGRAVAIRVGGLLVTLLVTSFLVFSALYLAPGDPVSFLFRGRTPSPVEIAAVRASLHLNQPFLVRYLNWLGGVLHGNFGYSYVNHQPVTQLIDAQLPSTLLLVAMSSVIVVIVGIGTGVVGAVRRNRASDRVIVLGVTVGAALPSFVAAILLTGLFAVHWQIFPVYGNGQGLTSQMYHLTLPAVALAITVFVYGLVAGIVRMDDVGMWLMRKTSAAAQALGRGLIAFTPWLMRGLSIVGTAAMFMVGGSLLVHGIGPIEHWIESTITPMGGVVAMLAPTLVHVVVGAAIGGLVVLAVEGWHKMRGH